MFPAAANRPRCLRECCAAVCGDHPSPPPTCASHRQPRSPVRGAVPAVRAAAAAPPCDGPGGPGVATRPSVDALPFAARDLHAPAWPFPSRMQPGSGPDPGLPPQRAEPLMHDESWRAPRVPCGTAPVQLQLVLGRCPRWQAPLRSARCCPEASREPGPAVHVLAARHSALPGGPSAADGPASSPESLAPDPPGFQRSGPVAGLFVRVDARGRAGVAQRLP
mmetsp:Transcript_10078/g.22608  ORF Transcript_10078/g.22608 Transcript_10078/m.22608 type:complete len:221 (+) Transcript_10078:340-1002(+)